MSQRDTLRTIWKRGGETLGAWTFIPSPVSAESCARAGFDYVCVDAQHGAIGYDAAVPMIQAIELGGSVPIARVPWNEPGIIGKMLDAGCHGVIVPMVNTSDEAEAVVRAVRYAPRGSRSWGPALAAPRHDDYRTWADNNIAVIPMIETAEALANVDDILSVEGVDAAYVGPADLAISLGLGPAGNDGTAIFDEALATIIDACVRHSVVPGIHATADLTDLRRQQGFKMITVSTDLPTLRGALAAELQLARVDNPESRGSKSGPY